MVLTGGLVNTRWTSGGCWYVGPPSSPQKILLNN
uniref:Uncharacterized protein n=1 Tax=Anguilla anguilla TaxID=7936 RepID=A0A0E9RBC5_ANGAN